MLVMLTAPGYFRSHGFLIVLACKFQPCCLVQPLSSVLAQHQEFELLLTHILTAEAMISQAAKLVCYQRYQQWRETRLERLVLWFDVYYPHQLNASKVSEVTS